MVSVCMRAFQMNRHINYSAKRQKFQMEKSIWWKKNKRHEIMDIDANETLNVYDG